MPRRTPTDLDARIGRRIKARRVELGMTQSILAERVGVALLTVQNFEQGVGNITLIRLFRIATALDTTIAALIGPDGDGTRLGFGDRPAHAALFEAFDRISSNRLQRNVIRLVETLADEAPAKKC